MSDAAPISPVESPVAPVSGWQRYRWWIVGIIVAIVVTVIVAWLIWLPPAFIRQSSPYQKVFGPQPNGKITHLNPTQFRQQALGNLLATPTKVMANQTSSSAMPTIIPIARPKVLIVDIRSSQAYQQGHLRLAQSIPFDKLNQISLGSGWTVIVYGDSATQVNQAGDIFRQKGAQEVYLITDSIQDLQSAGLGIAQGKGEEIAR